MADPWESVYISDVFCEIRSDILCGGDCTLHTIISQVLTGIDVQDMFWSRICLRFADQLPVMPYDLACDSHAFPIVHSVQTRNGTQDTHV